MKNKKLKKYYLVIPGIIINAKDDAEAKRNAETYLLKNYELSKVINK